MQDILLINPNASEASTRMMVRIAQSAVPKGFTVHGGTATRGPSMIVNPAELQAAALDVQRTWQRMAPDTGRTWAGIIVSAFGDPGIESLRAGAHVPVAGICEASLLEAASGGRRFGIATVTPELAGLIQDKVDGLGLTALYTGIRLTPGAPRELAADAPRLQHELALAVDLCIQSDGAQAVVIGGGPLAQAAGQLQLLYGVPIIEPIPAAVRQMMGMLSATPTLIAAQ